MKKPFLLFVMLSLGACSQAGSGDDNVSRADAAGGSTGSAGKSGAAGGGGSEATGGSLGIAGAPDTGGVRDTGGVSRAGGTTSSAGATSAAGTIGSAGATSAGGTTSGGGSSSSGGTKAAGGSTNVAGTSGSAGASASGGATSPGGSMSTGGAKGGTSATGGSSSSGGASASGGKTGSGGSTGSGGASGGRTGSGGSTGSGGASGGRTGSGGSSSSGGATGGSTGGSTGSGSTGVCSFASGLNVAWVQFAGDVPNPNLNTFNTIFKNTYNAGGRVIRWWFHTNGTVTPGYDSSGKAQKIPQTHIDGVKAILNAAATNKVAINISLWSFDMLQGSESIPAATLANNKSLLENDTNRQAYVDNYLTPLVTALKGTPGLYSYEIFNEPEGMGPSGWATGGRTTEAYIQKTVNWLAAAIHSADSNVLVTNGAQTFDYCSGVSGKNNYYSDSQLRSVGGKQNGTLDFYEVHYYTSNGASNSCFTYPASHWALDKKLVMGEFAAAATDGTALTDLFTKIYSTGYNGAWAWSYDADWKWPLMQTPMQNLYTAQKTTVDACP
jgi:hypothetical protein